MAELRCRQTVELVAETMLFRPYKAWVWICRSAEAAFRLIMPFPGIDAM